MRSEQEARQAIERYADTVRRICMLHLKNHADTEDIFQTVFLKYALYPGAFESDAHEKAWIIRVTVNAARQKPGPFRAGAAETVMLPAVSAAAMAARISSFFIVDSSVSNRSIDNTIERRGIFHVRKKFF